MVTKLTAWKTIAVKDATYAVATKKSLNFFESLLRSFALNERLRQACVYSRDNGHLLAGFAYEQILS